MKTGAMLEEILGTLLANDDLVLSDDTVLETMPGWDSLVQVNLMFAIEEQFGVRFAGNQISDFSTAGELERFIQKNAEARLAQS
jgi:acyl carrier protein